MTPPELFDLLFAVLPAVHDQHARDSRLYELLMYVARKEVEALFSGVEGEVRRFGPFGDLGFPYEEMGAVDSLNLFDLDELIIFSFYWTNRKRYRRVLDIGANLGLHSVLLSKCGVDVRAYEPDPRHFEILTRNLVLNGCSNVEPFNAGVSSTTGVMEFVRVLGNTTSSHLAGSKSNPYGEMERFPVSVEAIDNIMAWADLMKVDAEGHERDILLATEREHWLNTDALVEIENEENAAAVYEHLGGLGVRMFSQRRNWQMVRSIDDMPTSYRNGTLFVTCRSAMPWH